MSQIPKIIDVTKGFVVVDPNTFAENLGFTKQADSPDEMAPILPYEGYNFLPTSYGYRSYFGQNSTLSIPALPSKCDQILLYQLADYRNMAIALCEDGIYTSSVVTAGAMTWVHSVTLVVPTPAGTYKEYTHALIANELYIYRAGESSVYKFTSAGVLVTIVSTYGTTPVAVSDTAFSPFINVAGQLGIFRAANRLGFWDANNSISWSHYHMIGVPAMGINNFQINPPDNSIYFPSSADNQLYSAIIGRIVAIIPQGDNFVVYCTKSIVGCKFDNTAVVLYDGQSISDLAGIAYSKLVTRGITDLEHYAYTNIGIKKIGSYNAVNRSHAFETILPEVYDLLKESKDPVFLNLINGRFLTFSVVNPNYIDGIIDTSVDSISPYTFYLTVNGANWDGVYTANISAISPWLGYAPRTDWSFTKWVPGFGLAYSVGVVPSVGEIAGVVANGAPLPIATGGTIDTLAVNPVVLQSAPLKTIANTAGSSTAPVAGDWSLARTIPSPFLGVTDGLQTANLAANIAAVDAYQAACLAIETAYNNAVPLVRASTRVATGVPWYTFYSGQWYTTNGYDSVGHKAATTNIGTIPSSGHADTIVGPTAGYNSVMSTTYEFHNHKDVNRTVSHQATGTYRNGAVPGWYATLVTNFPYGATMTPVLSGLIFTQEGGVQADLTTIINAMRPDTFTVPNVDPLAVITGTMFDRPTGTYHVTNGYGMSTYNNSIYVLSNPTAGIVTVADVDDVETDSIALGAPYVSSIHATAIISSSQTTLNAGIATTVPQSRWDVPPFELNQIPTPAPVPITLPGSTFLLQNGSVAPYYADFYGALVYDMSLKKWGKMKGTHKALIDFYPLNSAEGSISYTNFGMEAGLITATYTMKLFDSSPVDSSIKYGKVGFLRGGFTKMEEIRAHFRGSSNAEVALNTSIDGRFLESTLAVIGTVNNAAEFKQGYNQTGVWHTITISGQWDLQYLEFRGRVAGKR